MGLQTVADAGVLLELNGLVAAVCAELGPGSTLGAADAFKEGAVVVGQLLFDSRWKLNNGCSGQC